MALTPDLVRVRFPEFAMVNTMRIEDSILEATIIMGDDVSRWLGQEIYYMANSYLVGHLIVAGEAMAMGDDSAMAPVRETEVDNVGIKYAVTMSGSFMDSELASTAYGKRYLFYRNMCFTGGVNA